MIATCKSFCALALANGRMVATDRKGRILLVVGYLLAMWLLYWLWRALYAGHPAHGGMTFSAALLHVATAQTLFAILQAFGDWRLAREIRDGSIAIQLVHPVSLPFRSAALSFGRVLAQAVYFLPAYVAFLYWADLRLAPASWLLALVSVLLSFVLLFAVDFMIGLAGFLATDLWGITASKDAVVQFLGGAMVPLSLFPPAFASVLHWLPFAHFFNTPVRYLTGAETALQPLLVQAIWAVLFVAGAQAASRTICRRMVIFGA